MYIHVALIWISLVLWPLMCQISSASPGTPCIWLHYIIILCFWILRGRANRARHIAQRILVRPCMCNLCSYLIRKSKARGVSADLEPRGRGNFSQCDLDAAQPATVLPVGSLTSEAGASTQSPCSRMRSINAPTASPSGTLRRTTSFSL